MIERKFDTKEDQEAFENAEGLLMVGMYSLHKLSDGGKISMRDASYIAAEISGLGTVLGLFCLIALRREGLIADKREGNDRHFFITSKGFEAVERYWKKYPERQKEIEEAIVLTRMDVESEKVKGN